MNLISIVKAVGTLFPVLFPKQEFKPQRLIAVVVSVTVIVVLIKIVGVENVSLVIDQADAILDLSEE